MNFEQRGREIKVAQLLTKCPLVATLAEREALAVAIETSPEWRASILSATSIKRASDESWRLLAIAIRSRPLASEEEVCEAAFVRRAVAS